MNLKVNKETSATEKTLTTVYLSWMIILVPLCVVHLPSGGCFLMHPQTLKKWFPPQSWRTNTRRRHVKLRNRSIIFIHFAKCLGEKGKCSHQQTSTTLLLTLRHLFLGLNMQMRLNLIKYAIIWMFALSDLIVWSPPPPQNVMCEYVNLAILLNIHESRSISRVYFYATGPWGKTPTCVFWREFTCWSAGPVCAERVWFLHMPEWHHDGCGGRDPPPWATSLAELEPTRETDQLSSHEQ